MSSQDAITRSANGEASGRQSAAMPPLSGPTRSTGSLAVTQTVVAPPSTSLVRIQWIVGLVMLVLALLAGARLWMIEGLTRVARIEGPSMAPAFLGGHYRVTCEDCRFVFRCDAEHPRAGGEASCPNCGYPTNALRDEDVVPGEKVIIDHWPLAVRRPRIGEVVAAADPANPGEIVIKRVAAPAGRPWAIRGGDLYVDGDLVCKSWRELSEVRILVHDNDYQPTKTAGIPDRWKGAQQPSSWHSAMTGFRCDRADAKQQIDWLEYSHHEMFGSKSRTRVSSVLDWDSYVLSETRLLNSVPDVLFSCRLIARGSGQFAVAALDGDQRFEAVFDPAKKEVVLLADDREIARHGLDLEFDRRAAAIEFGLCDQQVLLRVSGREIFRHQYNRTGGKRDVNHPLAIGSQGMALAVDQLRVWRDLYYLTPDGKGGDWKSPPSGGSLPLLGDNASVSVDSRQWTTGVAPSQVRGMVYRPFWSTAY